MNKNNFIKISLGLYILVLSACSFFDNSFFGSSETNIENIPQDSQSASSNNMQENLNNVLNGSQASEGLSASSAQGLNSNLSDVEILWLIPNEETEGFILSYGFSENSIDNKVTILSTELSKVTDPVYNQVYRYVLKNIPRDKVVYLQLVAFNGNNFSSPSKVFTLRAN